MKKINDGRTSEVNTFQFWVVEFFSRDTLVTGWAIFWRYFLTSLILVWIPIFGIIWAFNCLGWATRKILIEKEAPFFNGEDISLGWSVGWRQLLTLPHIFAILFVTMLPMLMILETYGVAADFFTSLLYLLAFLLALSLSIGWAAKRAIICFRTDRFYLRRVTVEEFKNNLPLIIIIGFLILLFVIGGVFAFQEFAPSN